MAEYSREENLAEFSAAICKRFHDPMLLETALTHRSGTKGATRGTIQDNRRLAFLGDAILGSIVSEHIWAEFPDWDSQKMTRCRQRLVEQSSLASVARQLDLGPLLHLGKGEEKTGVRDGPKTLANVYEAFVAAVFLDAGPGAARKFVHRSLLDRYSGDELEQKARKDAKTLQKEAEDQSKKGPTHA